MLQFHIQETNKISNVQPIYRANEYSFDISDMGGLAASVFACIAIDTLMIEISADGHFLYVDGYCNYISWIETDVLSPKARFGSIQVSGVELIMGAGIDFTKPGEWPIYFNKKTGWVCIGNSNQSFPFDAIEFATNTIAVINDKNLTAIWLKPVELPNK